MKKKKCFIWGAVLLVVAVLVFAFCFRLGSVIKASAETFGPMVLGTEVEIGECTVRPFAGYVHVADVRVGPPKDFKADVFRLGELVFSIDVKSLLHPSEPIHIREITVRGPKIVYEVKIPSMRDNLHAMLSGLEEKQKEEAEKEDGGSERKVKIDSFVFEEGRAKVALLGDNGLPVPLPSIHLTGIGEKSGGVTGLEATVQVLTSVVAGIIEPILDVVKASGKGVLTVGEGVGKGVLTVGKGVLGLGKGLVKAVSGDADEPAEEAAAPAEAAE